ncbi:MAG: hypothetical protein WAX79_06735 [Candidatus Omnitrophota bacterium]
MEIKKFIIQIIQIILFSVVLIVLPTQSRLAIGILFLPLGIIFLIFKKQIGETMYKKQIESVKRRSSAEKFIDGINHGGLLLSSVGIISILMSLLLKTR